MKRLRIVKHGLGNRERYHTETALTEVSVVRGDLTPITIIGFDEIVGRKYRLHLSDEIVRAIVDLNSRRGN